MINYQNKNFYLTMDAKLPIISDGFKRDGWFINQNLDLNDPEDLIFQDTLSRQFKGCNGTGREKAQLFAYH